MAIELFQKVALIHDIEEHGLREGDVATLIDFVPHPGNGEMGCVLEVFNALGESIKVVVVRKSDIEPLQADEVPAVRRLVCAA
ncbi:MAG: DUF4926 domain-containing protein [Candidatus Sumerlaeota bacterium]|nr:DUF4926 domain-containing protein [Candidatus Sumerlaeota bacterium]